MATRATILRIQPANLDDTVILDEQDPIPDRSRSCGPLQWPNNSTPLHDLQWLEPETQETTSGIDWPEEEFDLDFA